MTISYFHMPALSDGVEAMDRWMKSLPHGQQAKTLENCLFRVPSNGSVEGPFVSVPESGTAFLQEHGGQPKTAFPSDHDGDLISFDQLSSRLELVPSDDSDPASSLLILAEDLDAESFAELLSGLTLIRSKHQEILILEAEGDQQVTAIELIGTDPRDLTDGSLGHVSIFQIRDLGFRTATPLGLVHPMAEKTPGLIRITNPRNEVLIWRSDPTDDRKGGFVSMAVKEQRTRIPADFFIFAPKRFPTTTPDNRITPPSIEIHLEKSPAPSEGDDRRTARVLLELRGSSSGQSFRRLLDIMDEVDSGVLAEDTQIWTSRLGAGEASPTTHHICFRTDRPASEFATHGVRAFAQPEAFDSRSIPLFIEAGFSLRPAIDTILEVLPDQHSLIRQLTEEFPTESDGQPCHHFLRVNPHGEPSHHVLSGGERLIDHIGTIVAETYALPPHESRDADESNKLAKSIRAEKERNIENIRVTGEEESNLIRSEFDAILADLTQHVGAVEARITECSTRAASLSEIATSLEQSLAKTPLEWWTLQQAVETINSKIIEPRAIWLKRLDSEKAENWNQQKQAIKELADAKGLVNSRLAILKQWLSEAEKSRSELNRVLQQVQSVQEKLTASVAQASKDHQKASLVLERTSTELDLEAQRQAEVEKRILQRQQAISARQRDLEIKKSNQEQAERLAAQRGAQIDGEYDQLSNRKIRLEAEINRIDQLETQEIPELERSCNSLQKRLGSYDKESLEGKSRNLSDRRSRLNAELQSIQRTEKDLQIKEAANRDDEDQIREAKDLLEGREKKLHDRRVDQESRRKNLERRQRTLEAAEKAASERDRQDNATEETLQREEQKTLGIWERGGMWIRRMGGKK